MKKYINFCKAKDIQIKRKMRHGGNYLQHGLNTHKNIKTLLQFNKTAENWSVYNKQSKG